MSLLLSKLRLSTVAAALFGFSCISFAQAAVNTSYINLGAGGNALLRVPSPLGGSPRDQIGIFVMHPSSSFINSPICTELANRGYRTLCADNPFSLMRTPIKVMKITRR
jgi:hypothetical protein